MGWVSDRLPPEAAAFPPTTASQALFFDWLVLFWEDQAGRQADPARRDYCEDEAWRCSRLAGAYRREAARRGIPLPDDQGPPA